MNTNSQLPNPVRARSSGEGWAAIGAVGSAFLLAKKLLSPKAGQARADQPGRLLRRDAGHAEDRMHADHLAILEKLDANHRELLAALERQATRINALEAGLARVDERTRKLTMQPFAVCHSIRHLPSPICHFRLCLLASLFAISALLCGYSCNRFLSFLRFLLFNSPRKHFWRAQFGRLCRPRAPFRKQTTTKER